MELPSGVVALSVASGDPNRGEMDAASVVGQDWRLLKHPESSDSCIRGEWPRDRRAVVLHCQLYFEEVTSRTVPSQ